MLATITLVHIQHTNLMLVGQEDRGVNLRKRRTRIQCSMPKTVYLSECTEWINLDFVERERTPREIIEKGICHHLTGLSLSDTKHYLERLY
jgi:hypothetical protein